jgi:uncharacterized Fe-S cluster protein YjdI
MPADVHSGRAAEKLQQRQAILQQAYAAHPERFVRGAPVVPKLPDAVWINPPKGDGGRATHVIETSDLQPDRRQTTPASSNGLDAFGYKANMDYTPTAGAEDRATLRSDPSADVGDGVAGQGLTGPAHNSQTNQLHRQKSDKPKTHAAASLALPFVSIMGETASATNLVYNTPKESRRCLTSNLSKSAITEH